MKRQRSSNIDSNIAPGTHLEDELVTAEQSDVSLDFSIDMVFYRRYSHNSELFEEYDRSC